ncbi:MAG: hypothetical protein HDR97_00350 [Bacteroides sp.]|nr:hypothetical protein [Bacteroides sp.]
MSVEYNISGEELEEGVSLNVTSESGEQDSAALTVDNEISAEHGYEMEVLGDEDVTEDLNEPRDNYTHWADHTFENDVTIAGTLRTKRWIHPHGAMFMDKAELLEEIPHPVSGMWAFVGGRFPADIYWCIDNGKWELLKQFNFESYLEANHYVTSDWIERQGFLKRTEADELYSLIGHTHDNLTQQAGSFVKKAGDEMTGLLTAGGGVYIPSGESLRIGDAYLSWDPESESLRITSGLYSEKWVSARGKSDDSGSASGVGATLLGMLEDVSLGSLEDRQTLMYDAVTGMWVNRSLQQGLNTSELAEYLSSNGYATESWVLGRGYVHVSDLTAHTSNSTIHITADERSKWNNAANNLALILGANSDQVINKWEEIVAFLDTYTEADTLAGLLGNKADKAISILAGTGLTGGGTLAADRTLSLATSGVVAGTYTKLTVDAYGRATAGATLSPVDIPALAISKITGLQSALDSKLEAATFNELFEKVNIGTVAAPVYAIRAKYGFYSNEWISTRGIGDSSGGGGGIDEAFLAQWLVDNNYAKKSDIPSLAGYATQIWVQGQGYLTSASLSSYLTKTEASSFYQPKGNYLVASALNGYATEAWVNSQGFLKGHQSLANYVTLDTAQEITGAKTFDVGSWVLKATEKNEIKDVAFGNGTVGQGSTSSFSAIRRGIDFRWYDTHWIIGNFRGGSVDSNGFGIGLLNSDNKIDLGLRVTKDKVYSAGYATFNGTSSQFLKADGSVDESHYIKTDRKQTFNWVWKYNPTHIVGFDSADSSNMYVFDGATVRAFANAVNKSGDTMTGGLTLPTINIKGTASSNAYITADNSTNVFVNSAGKSLMVWDGNENTVRSARALAGSVPLGTADVRWSNLYATTINVSSTALVSNLNADLLDGLNSTDFARSLVGAGYVWNNNETVAEWSKRIASKPGLIMPSGWGWSLSTSLVLGSHTIDSQRYTAIDFRNGNLNYSWNQKAYMFLPAHSDVSMIYIAQMICENTAGQIATSVKRYADYDTVLASNVASATKLANIRTIWGQNFNGEENVSGSLSGVNHISPSANNTYDIGSPSVGFRYGYFHWLGAPTGATLTFGANNATHMAFLTNGNVGIGTTSPAYKAHIIGTVAASGDFRCLSQGGGIWFNRTGESNYIKSGDADNFAMFWDSEPESTRHSANLEIYSHCGIAFKTSCGGQARSGKIAVGIDTRNGNLKAAGWIRSNSLISDDWLLVGGGYIYWDDKNSALYTPTGFYSNSFISARGTADTSDMRLKRVVAPVELTLEQIAAAPLFLFEWRDGVPGVFVGTSAQYWEKVLPQLVIRLGGNLQLFYKDLGVAAGIINSRAIEHLAKRHDRWLDSHETRLQKVERENRELRKEVETLKHKLEQFNAA